MKCQSLCVNHALLKPFHMRDTSERISYKFYSCVLFIYNMHKCVCVHIWHKVGRSTNVGWLATFVSCYIRGLNKKRNNFHHSYSSYTHIRVVNFPRQILFISCHFSYIYIYNINRVCIWRQRVRSINQIHERCIKFSHRYIFSSSYIMGIHEPYKRVESYKKVYTM